MLISASFVIDRHVSPLTTVCHSLQHLVVPGFVGPGGGMYEPDEGVLPGRRVGVGELDAWGGMRRGVIALAIWPTLGVGLVCWAWTGQ